MRIVRWLTIRAVTTWCLAAAPAQAQDAPIERGKHLVTFGACNDCQTFGTLLGKPGETNLLAGSNVRLAISDLGVIVGRDLTPDSETGLGS